MKRRHRMPFGAGIDADGRVRFRLWAPGAKTVELCLQDRTPETVLDMRPEHGGWFTLATECAAAGALYAYRIDGGQRVPDPASRFQPQDVHGPSQVIDPGGFDWQDGDWRGRPWEHAVFYELHVGTFSTAGNFAAVAARLDYLAGLGITALELMPVCDFPGQWNWGYDGALPFAPDSRYGGPGDLKELVQAAHRRGLMVFLDVVYNHFGPEGNYLHLYAPDFFTERHHTPWGAAINFDGAHSSTVREFFIHNALYWLEEYHFDGLRLDAVHAVIDDSQPDILVELAERVRQGPCRERQVHLVLENDHNEPRYLERRADGSPRWYNAQWNDDLHHGLHVLLTGENDGYYADYADRPVWYTARSLTEGFAYQGESSRYRGGRLRGAASAALPPTAFVSFLQNHDQTGNRAFGERIDALAEHAAVEAAAVIYLLAPAPPLLFMGEEFAATTPFQYFCDLEDGLAGAVTEGRRGEFAHFERFSDPAARERIPDPGDSATFVRSRLDWDCLHTTGHAERLEFYRRLLALRRTAIIPRLRGIRGMEGRFRLLGETGLRASWRLGDGSTLTLLANLAGVPLPLVDSDAPRSAPLCTCPGELAADLAAQQLPPFGVAWFLEAGAVEQGL
ncbi:MAG: malto-oligosyltrehalose trehalohydrolase [Gammaproteobacteria bacterium]